jgi:hypothetical protein
MLPQKSANADNMPDSGTYGILQLRHHHTPPRGSSSVLGLGGHQHCIHTEAANSRIQLTLFRRYMNPALDDGREQWNHQARQKRVCKCGKLCQCSHRGCHGGKWNGSQRTVRCGRVVPAVGELAGLVGVVQTKTWRSVGGSQASFPQERRQAHSSNGRSVPLVASCFCLLKCQVLNRAA